MPGRALLPLLVVAGLVIGLAACERRVLDPEIIARDLDAYVEKMREWEPDQKKVFRTIEDVERTHYVDDEFVARTFKTVLPELERHARVARGYEPGTEDVKMIHERYREAWADLEAAVRGVIGAMERHDYVELAKEKNKLVDARRRLLEAFKVLDELLQAYDRELDALREEPRDPV